MKLSEAMMLGSVTCKMEAADWNSCALGCAGNAIGIPQAAREKDGYLVNYVMADGRCRHSHIEDAWPWLLEDGGMGKIWGLFDYQVCEGRLTFEQLVDFVRSIEPACGDCNRFDCTCKTTRDTLETRDEQILEKPVEMRQT